MIFIRRFPALALALTAAALVRPVEARAQALLSMPLPQPNGRLIVDGYLSQFRLALPDARARLDGVGGRVMWTLAPTETPRRDRLAEHIAIGGFVGTTSDDALVGNTALRTSLVGAQVDVRPLRAPVAGLVEPVVSLGGGVMRLQETHTGRLLWANGELVRPRDVPFAAQPAHLTKRESHTVLTPAVGLVVTPAPGFALRLDVRQLIAQEERLDRGSELAAGVSLRL